MRTHVESSRIGIPSKLVIVGALALVTTQCVAPPVASIAPAPAYSESDAQLVDIRSEALSRFYGREIRMHAGVVAPPDLKPDETISACYQVHGFGGSHRAAWEEGAALVAQMQAGTMPRMLYVYLDASCASGHHEFVDSVNNGPWGQALVTELLPAIETRFLGPRAPEHRFVTGHSSGGWCALWLQITYPHLFDGCWATAPDPVTFRDFSGVDLYTASNLYFDESGRERQLVRSSPGHPQRTFREFAHDELEAGTIGGQMASFDAVFSPRGDDGRPLPMFDRRTGAIDHDVVDAWRRCDLVDVLQKNWTTLAPKLAGKLHVWVGEDDTYHLEGAVKRLDEALKELGSDVDVIVVPGRTHSTLREPHPDLWPLGMKTRIRREMWKRTLATAS